MRKTFAIGILGMAATGILGGCAIPPDIYYEEQRREQSLGQGSDSTFSPWEMQDETDYKKDLSR